MKTIAEYERLLRKMLEQDEGCVILLKGCWGRGKTYFWKHFAKNYFSKEEKYSYVSLFGKVDIDQIQTEILVQAFKRNKFIKKFKELLSSVSAGTEIGIGISGQILSMPLALLEGGDLNGLCICIDDFERKSHGLAIAEVLGYASILSEHYACKVVLIMDESKILAADYNECAQYKEYKEKVVSYELLFEPDLLNVCKVLLEDCSYSRSILRAIEKSNETNLRSVIKAKWFLEVASQRICQGLEQEFKEELAYRISLLLFLLYSSGDGAFKQLSNFKKHIAPGDYGYTQNELDSSHYCPVKKQIISESSGFMRTAGRHGGIGQL